MTVFFLLIARVYGYINITFQDLKNVFLNSSCNTCREQFDPCCSITIQNMTYASGYLSEKAKTCSHPQCVVLLSSSPLCEDIHWQYTGECYKYCAWKDPHDVYFQDASNINFGIILRYAGVSRTNNLITLKTAHIFHRYIGAYCDIMNASCIIQKKKKDVFTYMASWKKSLLKASKGNYITLPFDCND